MATTRKPKAAPTNDDLLKQFDDLGVDDVPPASKGTAAKTSKAAAASQAEQDLLAELENLGAEKPASRPHTPRIGTKVSPIKRTATGTPPPASSNRSSEDKNAAMRKSGESTRSFHTSFTPSATSSDLQEAEKKSPIAQPAEPAVASGGGWWGGLLATASAAVKTAESAVKEIQQNEEAKRWAEQVKGNVGVLRGFGKFTTLVPEFLEL